MSFSPADIDFVDIFPPINVARVGDSDEWYLGPEIPGTDPIPKGKFKDGQGKIKKQAARFRIYAYGKDSKVLGEITNKDYDIQWTAQVANKKGAWIQNYFGQYRKPNGLRNKGTHNVVLHPADTPHFRNTDERSELIIINEEKVVPSGSEPVVLQGEFTGSDKKKNSVRLGAILTDEAGRLIFLPGSGEAQSVVGDKYPELQDGFDNDDWVDTVCDGWVKAKVTSKANQLPITVKNRATIITAPPKFAPGVSCVTSLFDLIEDIYWKRSRKSAEDVGEVKYHRHIEPVFRAVYGISWTNDKANEKHGPGKPYNMLFDDELSNPTGPKTNRVHIFKQIRHPVIKGDDKNKEERRVQAKPKFMPQLSGDDGDANKGYPDTWASVTELQYARFKKWAEGDFTKDEPEPRYSSFEEIPLEKQPDALTKAPLEWCTGAALYPGIEVYWIVQWDDMYSHDSNFRFSDNIQPGDLGKGLALPWQSDFYMCRKNWWPSARPDSVVPQPPPSHVSEAHQHKPEEIEADPTGRKPWARGIGNGGENGFLDNLEMVKKWTKLGFVAPKPYLNINGTALPAWEETERDSSLGP